MNLINNSIPLSSMKQLNSLHQLYGNLEKNGILLQFIDQETVFQWSPQYDVDCLHLILNLNGQGVFLGDKVRMSLSSGMLGLIHHSAQDEMLMSRVGQNHQVIVLSISRGWIERSFGNKCCSLHPDLQKLLSSNQASHSIQIGKARRMSLQEQELSEELLTPPVQQQAMVFWYSAKVLELLSIYLFAPAASGFCSQREFLAQQRIRKVMHWLHAHLDEKLDLQRIAAEAGCSPHYLSRIFSEHKGHTISQQLRKLRVDKAAEYLRAGDYNVTEAAMEVGYSSLSHFSKAFLAEIGVKPSQYIKNVC